MNRLQPQDELALLRELGGNSEMAAAFDGLRESFNVLQVRSQMLLGLITICLTITGFSGHRIAQAGLVPRICVFAGVVSVLASALALVCGPLQLRWLTRYRAETLERTALLLIQRRDARTRLYHLATACLVVGLTAYVLALGFFLLAQ